MAQATFDAKSFSIIVGPNIASGLSKSKSATLNYEADLYTTVTGIDGFTTRSKLNNYTAELKIFVQQTSRFNDYLSLLVNLDKASGDGVVPIIIKDLRGTTTAVSAFGFISKMPNLEIGAEVGEYEWTFKLVDTQIFLGGNS